MKKLVFLGFDKTLPELAAQRIFDGEIRGKDTVIDLSQTILIMPGSFASREFHCRLAGLLQQGIFPPEVMTQGRFLELERSLENAADEKESEAIWAETLFSCDHTKYPSLFPSGRKPALSECFYLGKLLASFLKELCLGGLTLEDAIKKTPGTDTERRKEILELEGIYRKLLAKYALIDRFSLLHFNDPQTAEEAQKHRDLAKYKKIIVSGVPGLLPAVQKRLENFADERELEIWIQAPPSMEEYFDEWGNPVPEKWENVAFEQGEDEKTFFHTEKASSLVHLAVAVSSQTGNKNTIDLQKSAFIAADPSLFPYFEQELQNFNGKDLQVYDPSGTPFCRTRSGRLLLLILDFVQEDSFEVWEKLARHEDYLQYCKTLYQGPENAFLGELDALSCAHLPDFLSSALAFAGENMKKVLEKAIETKAALSHGCIAENLASFLAEIYSIATPEQENCSISFDSQIRFLEEFLRKCAKSPILSTLPPEGFYPLLKNEMKSEVLYGELDKKRVDIHGFLELPNIAAPELFICGMSEGIVPERIDFNPFINDSQRIALGLPGNAHRAARDAFYLYESIARRRKMGGRVYFFASKFSRDNTPLKFSPFFFRGKQEKMLERASLLFADPVAMQENEMENGEKKADGIKGFFYRIPVTKYREKLERKKVSVTSLATYLADPLHFFLQHIMGMQLQDYSVREMDDPAFGNACHFVMEKLQEDKLRNESEMRKNMKYILEEYLKTHYGETLPFLLDFQKDLVLQRLYAAIPILLEERKNYTLLCKEYTLGGDKKEGGKGVISFADLSISGRIDRMELSTDKKTLRVLDFKTSNISAAPESAHLKGKKGEKEFISLQLPLYAILLKKDPFFARKFPQIDWQEVKILCGYFNLPKAVTQTEIRIWENMDLYLEKAEEKVYEISRNLDEMKEGIFRGDPDKKIAYDDFAGLFQALPTAVLRGVSFPDAPNFQTQKEEEEK